jgi:hypothetical protein
MVEQHVQDDRDLPDRTDGVQILLLAEDMDLVGHGRGVRHERYLGRRANIP